MDFSSSLTAHADAALLVVTGELDAATAQQVRRQTDDALLKGRTRFTVDVAGLTFIDAAGLGAFVHLHNATTRVGGTLTFAATSPRFRRVCRLAGLTNSFGPSALAGPTGTTWRGGSHEAARP
jgi:anti-sigma B factor antagonist